MKTWLLLSLATSLQAPAGSRSLGGLFAATGFVGPLLVLAGAIALVLAVRRWLELRPARLAPESTVKQLELGIRARKLDDALQTAVESPTVLGRVVSAGLYLRSGGLDEMLANVERAMAKELLRLGNRVANLARLGGIVLLVGLFGTAVSLMSAMLVLGSLQQPTLNNFMIGLGESLVCTAIAIFIALFSFGAFFVLDSKLTQRGLAVREIAEEMIRDAAAKHGASS